MGLAPGRCSVGRLSVKGHQGREAAVLHSHLSPGAGRAIWHCRLVSGGSLPSVGGRSWLGLPVHPLRTGEVGSGKQGPPGLLLSTLLLIPVARPSQCGLDDWAGLKETP